MMRSALRLTVVFLLTSLLPPTVSAEDEEEPARPRGQRSMWERLKGWDENGDGKITRDEFQGPDRLWQRLDGDRSGDITQAEAEKAMSSTRRGGRRGDPAQTAPGSKGLLLEHVDADGNGVITRAEWESFFKAADLDRDGLLSQEEWGRVVNPPSRAGGQALAVGQAAPQVKAVTLDGKTVVDLAAPKRTTVLVFGSWT